MTDNSSSFLDDPIDFDEFDNDEYSELVSDDDGQLSLSSQISELKAKRRQESRQKSRILSELSRRERIRRQRAKTNAEQLKRQTGAEQFKSQTDAVVADEPESDSDKVIRLADRSEVETACEQMDELRAKETLNVLQGLLKGKQIRIPEFHTVAELTKLAAKTPALESYIKDTADYVRFCHLFDAAQFTLPPILLVGEPGAGKTHFVTRIAGILNLECHVVPISEATDGFYLSGLQKGYTLATPGRITHRIAQGDSANPVVVFDELDKVSWTSDAARKPLLPVLLQMLEPASAADYRDMCLDVAVNLSQISFICTANTLDNIPKPILSRLTVIEMNKPGGSQMKVISESILNQVSNELMQGGCAASFYMTDPCVPLLETLNPRDINKIARQLVIKKLLKEGVDNDIYITPEELTELLKNDEAIGLSNKAKNNTDSHAKKRKGYYEENDDNEEDIELNAVVIH